MKLNFNSIQARLSLMVSALLLVTILSLGFSSNYLAQQLLLRATENNGQAVASDYAFRVHAYINEATTQLEDLASIPQMRNSADRAVISSILAENLKRIGKFESMSYVTLDSIAIRADGSFAKVVEQEQHKKAKATKQPVVSKVTVAASTGKMSVIIAVPVLESGELKGLVTGVMSLEKVTGIIANTAFKQTGHALLIDSEGLLLANPKQPEHNGKLNYLQKKVNPEFKTILTELDDRLIALVKSAGADGKQVLGSYTGLDGVERIGVLMPLELPGGQRWILLVTAPEAEVFADVKMLTTTMVGIGTVCLIFSLLVAVIASRSFVRPILALRNEAKLIADGNLEERPLAVIRADELGDLAQAFTGMSANLRGLVRQVQRDCEQLAAASEQLTASSDQSLQAANQVAASITDVAQGADDQLAAVSDTSAVVEQMSASIQQIAANTNHVAGRSAQAADKAKDGGNSVDLAVNQMVQIEQTVNTSAEVVSKLGERSKDIGQIVDTISGIAGQTNLLALNAAIEAARAGEQGRGFAVVAEEVRKLAEQSQEAAKQIADMIREIQEDTGKAVIAMNDGTREVKKGTTIIDATGQAFREIAELVAQVSAQVKEISSAIEQIASGSSQIVDSVQKIDELSKKAARESQTVSAATQEQSASMEEIASSSQGLAQLAQELQEELSKFRI